MMLKRLVFVLLLTTAVSIFANEDSVEEMKAGQPKLVAALIDRIVDCNHWSGEEPYDAERRQEIQSALNELRCDKLAGDEADLLKKYRNDSKVKKAIEAAKDVFL